MVAEHLTIRNLTSTPITLQYIERFRSPDHYSNGLSCLTSNLSRVWGGAAAASLKHNAHPFAEEADLSIYVEPFTTAKTEIRAFIDNRKERLRWTFEAADGAEKHQVQTPICSSESATMKSLSDSPRFQFTGVYLAAEAHLAIYSSANLHAWMRELKDNTLLSSLSIPGTHNSPTYHFAPPSVRCQAVSPREQLRNGVRFFDIRVQPLYPENPEKDELVLVHGVFPIALTGRSYFRDLIGDVNAFLDANPSETLIISLKREGPGTHTDEQLSRILADHYVAPDNSKWYTEPKIPTLGEARGKIILIRRFNIEERLKRAHDRQGWGIDAAGWADNCAHAFCPTGQVCMQDFYAVMNPSIIEKKIELVSQQCHRASQTCYPFGVLPASPDGGKDHPFYVNFLSASNFWKLGTWPENIAARLNPATVDYLCRWHSEAEGECDWSTGILVTDWVGYGGNWDLVRCIVGMNSRLKLRQERSASN